MDTRIISFYQLDILNPYDDSTFISPFKNMILSLPSSIDTDAEQQAYM